MRTYAPASTEAVLRAILEEVLLEVMYELPSRSDVVRCDARSRGRVARPPGLA